MPGEGQAEGRFVIDLKYLETLKRGKKEGKRRPGRNWSIYMPDAEIADLMQIMMEKCGIKFSTICRVALTRMFMGLFELLSQGYLIEQPSIGLTFNVNPRQRKVLDKLKLKMFNYQVFDEASFTRCMEEYLNATVPKGMPLKDYWMGIHTDLVVGSTIIVDHPAIIRKDDSNV